MHPIDGYGENGDERSASVKGGEFFCQTSDWQILYAESALWSKWRGSMIIYSEGDRRGLF
jgi:hypothetical protein